jgi:hypothetical protein
MNGIFVAVHVLVPVMQRLFLCKFLKYEKHFNRKLVKCVYKNFKLKIYSIRVDTVAVGTKNETVLLRERKLFQRSRCVKSLLNCM